MQASRTGVAAGEPRLDLRAFVDFGGVRVGAPVAIPVELRNIGLGPLVISELTFDPTGSATFTIPAPPGLPLTIDPGPSQTLDVRFAPTANGNVATTLQIVAGARNAAAVRITGTGSTTGAGLLAVLLHAVGVGGEPDQALV